MKIEDFAETFLREKEEKEKLHEEFNNKEIDFRKKANALGFKNWLFHFAYKKHEKGENNFNWAIYDSSDNKHKATGLIEWAKSYILGGSFSGVDPTDETLFEKEGEAKEGGWVFLAEDENGELTIHSNLDSYARLLGCICCIID